MTYPAPLFDLTDRVVLITGGSKGIGLACARGFLDEGARVTLVSRDPAHLEAGVQALRAGGPLDEACLQVRTADLRDPAAALAALDSAEQDFGPVDVLVNSAGAARHKNAARNCSSSPLFSTVTSADPHQVVVAGTRKIPVAASGYAGVAQSGR